MLRKIAAASTLVAAVNASSNHGDASGNRSTSGAAQTPSRPASTADDVMPPAPASNNDVTPALDDNAEALGDVEPTDAERAALEAQADARDGDDDMQDGAGGAQSPTADDDVEVEAGQVSTGGDARRSVHEQVEAVDATAGQVAARSDGRRSDDDAPADARTSTGSRRVVVAPHRRSSASREGSQHGSVSESGPVTTTPATPTAGATVETAGAAASATTSATSAAGAAATAQETMTVNCKGNNTPDCMKKVLGAAEKTAKKITSVTPTDQQQKFWGLTEDQIKTYLANDTTSRPGQAAQEALTMSWIEAIDANETAEVKEQRETQLKGHTDYIEGLDAYKATNSKWNKPTTNEFMKDAYNKLSAIVGVFDGFLDGEIRYDVKFEEAPETTAASATQSRTPSATGVAPPSNNGAAPARSTSRSGLNLMASEGDRVAAPTANQAAASETEVVDANVNPSAAATGAASTDGAADVTPAATTPASKVETLNPLPLGEADNRRGVVADLTTADGLSCCCLTAIISSSVAAAGGIAAAIVYFVAPKAYGCGSEDEAGNAVAVSAGSDNGSNNGSNYSNNSNNGDKDGENSGSGCGMYIAIAAAVGVLVLVYVGCSKKNKDDEDEDDALTATEDEL